MKRLYLTVICLIAIVMVKAQDTDYRPFVEEGKTWLERESAYTPYLGGLTTSKRQYTISGDTLIGQTPCQKVISEITDRIKGTKESGYMMALYEEDKRVYSILPGSETPLLLYDFSVEIGDTLTIYLTNGKWSNSCKVVALRKDKKGITLGNISLKEMLHHDELWEWTWIEGVGSERGPWMNMTYGIEMGGWQWLEDCRIGDEVLYHNNKEIYYFPFIEKDKAWSYNFMYNYDQIWLPAGEAFASEDWQVTESVEVHGKTYWKLCRNSAFTHVKSMWRPPYSDEDERAVKGEVIAIREEGGKIYALKEQYLKLLNGLYPKEVHPTIDHNAWYVAEAEDPNEVLLYDFSLEEGDPYPCIGEVFVESIGHYVTTDNRYRKLLRLSNGATLVEGIGCVNSIGGIIIYQNLENIREYFSSDFGTERMIYGLLHDCRQADYDHVIYPGAGGYLTSIITPTEKSANGKSVNSKWSDLSGRRLTATPSCPGLYIKNGRKVLIK